MCSPHSLNVVVSCSFSLGRGHIGIKMWDSCFIMKTEMVSLRRVHVVAEKMWRPGRASYWKPPLGLMALQSLNFLFSVTGNSFCKIHVSVIWLNFLLCLYLLENQTRKVGKVMAKINSHPQLDINNFYNTGAQWYTDYMNGSVNACLFL